MKINYISDLNRCPHRTAVIDTDLESFCIGCNDADLIVKTEKMYANGQICEQFNILTCSNLAKCVRLKRHFEEHKITL